jgi:hypothetical protein
MIDERHLTALLDDAAAPYEPPAGGPAGVLAKANATSTGTARAYPFARRPFGRRTRRTWALASAVVAIVVIVLAAIAGDGGQEARMQTAGGQFPATTFGEDGAAAVVAEPRAASGGGSGGDEALGAATSGGGAADVAAPGGPLAQAAPGPRIVKTGSLEIELDHGAFETTVARLTSLAVGAGGFVSQSTTSEDEGGTRGQVTIRVPSASFDQVTTDARRLGTVRNASVAGQDVTAEFTDLEARLRGLQATRDQLLTLLRQARTIPDILGVQDRVNQVQLEIEQTQGRINQLNDQSSFGTLTVVLFEEGADDPLRTERDGQAGAWDDAKEGFTDGVEALVAGSGTALFVLLLLAIAAAAGHGVWRLVRRRLV